MFGKDGSQVCDVGYLREMYRMQTSIDICVVFILTETANSFLTKRADCCSVTCWFGKIADHYKVEEKTGSTTCALNYLRILGMSHVSSFRPLHLSGGHFCLCAIVECVGELLQLRYALKLYTRSLCDVTTTCAVMCGRVLLAHSSKFCPSLCRFAYEMAEPPLQKRARNDDSEEEEVKAKDGAPEVRSRLILLSLFVCCTCW